jgi:hypothetical protein
MHEREVHPGPKHSTEQCHRLKTTFIAFIFGPAYAKRLSKRAANQLQKRKLMIWQSSVVSAGGLPLTHWIMPYRIVSVRLKLGILAVGLAGLLSAQLENANFDIRFEPDAKLQTGAPIPYRITIKDDLGKPVPRAEVSLQIETPDHKDVQIYKAPMLDAGMYLAKPVFPHAGQWSVTVNAHRREQVSSRTIEYTVPD